jgi:very-short-patch-repair endonuclease
MRTSPHAGPPQFLRRRDLLDLGWTDRALRRAVRDGRIVRPRAGVYLPAESPDDLLDACALGGRLTCVSELARRGVFVLDASSLHVHLHAARPKRPLLTRRVRRHWGRLSRAPHPRAAAVEVLDALACAMHCQPPRAALATLDSALFLGVVGEGDLDELFRMLPSRHRALLGLVDARAESGPETLLRLILRTLGVSVHVQVVISGVGRVDFVVDGWLIVECDSEQFHAGWEAQRRDRRRDQAAAARGYTTYRPIAEDILWHPDRVRAALAGLLEARRRTGSRRRAGAA